LVFHVGTLYSTVPLVNESSGENGLPLANNNNKLRSVGDFLPNNKVKMENVL
jgi:hypothetical protein